MVLKKIKACYEKSMKIIGSGSNLVTLSDKARELDLSTYKKKSNYDKHWFVDSPSGEFLQLLKVKKELH